MNKRVTIYDIAKELGISIATVNRALTDKLQVSVKTKQRVLAKAKEMGFIPNTLARSLARQPIRLAVVAFTTFPEFHDNFLKGALASADELRDYNVIVDCYSFKHGSTNSELGKEFLKRTYTTIMENQYDGALVCAKESEYNQILYDSGIHVATAINDILPSQRSFCVRHNGSVAGSVAAELMWHYGDPEKPVYIASGGDSQYSIHSETINGFMKQLDFTPFRQVKIYEHFDDPALAYTETIRILDECPDIGGIYINSFNSYGVIRAVLQRGLAGKICLIASDIYPELRDFIRDGVVSASLFQNQYRQGKTGLRLLYHSIADNQSVQDTITVEPQIILRSNVDLF